MHSCICFEREITRLVGVRMKVRQKGNTLQRIQFPTTSTSWSTSLYSATDYCTTMWFIILKKPLGIRNTKIVYIYLFGVTSPKMKDDIDARRIYIQAFSEREATDCISFSIVICLVQCFCYGIIALDTSDLSFLLCAY